MAVYVLNKFQPNPYPGAVEIDTTSRGQFKHDLSPFYLGPVIWEDLQHGPMRCEIFENFWQYSKVYPEHTTDGEPNQDFYLWQLVGFAKRRADRYPMGKGAKPLYSMINGVKYGYVDARKWIYVPAYMALVLKTPTFMELCKLAAQGTDIVLRDFDGYDYITEGITLVEVLNDPTRSMGHGFVIAMMLDFVLKGGQYEGSGIEQVIRREDHSRG